MSRGLGKTQRAILAELEQTEHASILDLAETLFACEYPTPAQYESVRRAIRGLIERGLVAEMPGVLNRQPIYYENGPRVWVTHFTLPAHAEKIAAEQRQAFIEKYGAAPEIALKRWL